MDSVVRRLSYFGGLKKWSEDKLISNLRFFVTGDVKDCVRQKCSDETPTDLDELEAEVARFLGGTLDPISAIHALENVLYEGSVERTMLRIGELIPLAYPTLPTKNDRQQMVLLHLHKLLPETYQRELIKGDVRKLEEAVTVISGLERADRSVGKRAAVWGANRVVSGAEEQPAVNKQCFVCGQTDHVKAGCPFKQDICGKCERRGHLGSMCRSKRGNWARSAPGGSQQARLNPRPPQQPPRLPAVQQLMPPRPNHPGYLQPGQQQQQQQPEWSRPPPPVGEQVPHNQAMGHSHQVGM